MTRSSFDIPANVNVTEANFPYLLRETNRQSGSYITISLGERAYLDGLINESAVGDREERTLFYIEGGAIEGPSSANFRDLPRHSIKLRHSFARDEESDPAYIATFELAGLHPLGMAGGWLSFAAMLTEARFYPGGVEGGSDPFTGAVRQDESENYYANAGYPFMPPHVNFGERVLRLPVEVEITLTYDVPNLAVQLDETLVRHAAARVARQAKREQAVADERQRQQERRRQEQEWLTTTEEGMNAAVGLRVREQARAQVTADSNNIEAATSFGAAFVAELTETDAYRYRRGVAEIGRPFIPSRQVARRAFFDGFEAELSTIYPDISFIE